MSRAQLTVLIYFIVSHGLCESIQTIDVGRPVDPNVFGIYENVKNGRYYTISYTTHSNYVIMRVIDEGVIIWQSSEGDTISDFYFDSKYVTPNFFQILVVGRAGAYTLNFVKALDKWEMVDGQYDVSEIFKNPSDYTLNILALDSNIAKVKMEALVSVHKQEKDISVELTYRSTEGVNSSSHQNKDDVFTIPVDFYHLSPAVNVIKVYHGQVPIWEHEGTEICTSVKIFHLQSCMPVVLRIEDVNILKYEYRLQEDGKYGAITEEDFIELIKKEFRGKVSLNANNGNAEMYNAKNGNEDGSKTSGFRQPTFIFLTMLSILCIK
ncbi:signal peptide-containing protein [Theileria equi strain WA]|uniref:Signal peptide-containing protein n=1 Tax=Theileria equi strain WA TaxID=1537102 RepID=L0B0M6_THEEQ|nr:signal peptide-containing protein [Theileria equi strain WA]AFZ80694.1 signal peptide-containing protein [Theileria equi strain WA]|eukprot:XP_004830360.1 signal peptide-containing protein [Theileria equi strain WA]